VFVPAYRRDQYASRFHGLREDAGMYDATLQNAYLTLGCGCSRTSQEKLKLGGRGHLVEAAMTANLYGSDGGVKFLSTTTCKVCSNLQQFEDCFFCWLNSKGDGDTASFLDWI
jgi:hypothetical protein